MVSKERAEQIMPMLEEVKAFYPCILCKNPTWDIIEPLNGIINIGITPIALVCLKCGNTIVHLEEYLKAGYQKALAEKATTVNAVAAAAITGDQSSN